MLQFCDDNRKIKKINSTLIVYLSDPNRFYTALIFTLIFIDSFFITASWLNYNTDLVRNDYFDLTSDYSYSEKFQYCKEFAIAVIFIKVFKNSGDYIFIIWGLLFTYMLLDDSKQIHEIVGGVISNYFFGTNPLNLGLRGQDFGEIIIVGLVGSVFISFLIKYFYKSKQAVKVVSFNLASLVILLVFCGVFIDMAHSMFPKTRGIATLEDGGEMIAMSLICWYSYNVLRFSPESVPSILNKSSLQALNTIANHFYNYMVRVNLMQRNHNENPS